MNVMRPGAPHGAPPPPPPRAEVERTTVLSAHDLGTAAVRIPALLRCADGRLLVFAEARHEGAGDSGRIEVVARTSRDGAAWGAPVVVARAEGRTMGNPVPIEAADGDIVLLTTSNDAGVDESEILAGTVGAAAGRRVHLTRLSADLSRIGPCRDVTDQVEEPGWDWYATGPGHGARLADGRLVVAANHSSRTAGGTPRYAAHGLVSEDDGRSWAIAWIARGTRGAPAPNESALTPIPADDGRGELLVTCRLEDPEAPGTRSLGRLSPADLAPGRTLEASGRLRPLEGFRGPRIQVGLAAAPPSPTGAEALLTSPVDAAARRDLVLHEIIGSACRPLVLLQPGPAGYSDLVVTDREILVLVETGEARTHERIDLLRADLAAIAAVALPALSKEHTS